MTTTDPHHNVRAVHGAATTLYAVITEYDPGQITTELFPTRQARIDSLIERATHFFTTPGHIPQMVREDENRLAALTAALLRPATISLTESVLDTRDGTYRPLGPCFCVH